jgi:hypothetical protein
MVSGLGPCQAERAAQSLPGALNWRKYAVCGGKLSGGDKQSVQQKLAAHRLSDLIQTCQQGAALGAG